VDDASGVESAVGIDVVDLLELGKVDIFAAEGLHDADAVNVFGEGGSDAGGLLADFAVGDHGVLLEKVGSDGEGRDDGGNGEAKTPIVLKHENGDAEEGEETGDHLICAPGENSIE
jgi:hypothetical protein